MQEFHSLHQPIINSYIFLVRHIWSKCEKYKLKPRTGWIEVNLEPVTFAAKQTPSQKMFPQSNCTFPFEDADNNLPEPFS